MADLVKYSMLINLTVIIMQSCVLIIQINRWNEVVGSIFSIIVALIGHMAAFLGEPKERSIASFYAILLVSDILFQVVNMILLISVQWVMIQYCLYSDIYNYGGILCYDWLHFGKQIDILRG